MRSHRFTAKLLPLLAALSAAVLPATSLHAALNPGDVAIIGYITNGSPDSFSFVALAPLPAGTVLHFTDNGWTGTGFRGVTTSDADGNENLTRFSAINTIPAGTIIRSNASSPDFTWATSGAIGAGGNYAPLSLSQSGEQITVVEATVATNPLFSGYTSLFQIDNTGAFENATASDQGNIAPGLSPAAKTAVLFNSTTTFAAFNLAALPSGSAANWRDAIANPANWSFTASGTLPSGSITVGSGNSNSAPTISALTPLSGVISDPTNPGISFTVNDAETPADSLVVTAIASSNPAVAPLANIAITTQPGGLRTLFITPAAVGYSDITLQVTDASNQSSQQTLSYAASAATPLPANSRHHTGSSDASTAIAIDADHMLVADDEDQALRLYRRNVSGLPLAYFDFTSSLGLTDLSGGTPREVDLEASTRLGNRIYWLGSHGNAASDAALRVNRHRIYATDLIGTGASTTLTYAGQYAGLRSALITWGDAHGYDFTASTTPGKSPEDPAQDGFNIEGLTIAPDGHTTYLAFRAPQVPADSRTRALVVPLYNLPELISGAETVPDLGDPITLDLGGRGIRSIERNSFNQYLILAGPASSATDNAPTDFRLYVWSGDPEDAPEIFSNTLTALSLRGSPEGIVSVPAPLMPNQSVQLVVDCGDTDWYGDGTASKDLSISNFKKFRSEKITLGAFSTEPVLVTLKAIDASASETGSDPATFRFIRTGDLSSPLIVAFLVSDAAGQAANDGSDYAPALDNLIEIPAGSAFADLVLTPVDDAQAEPSESITLTVLSSEDYATGSNDSATAAINDNDSAAGTLPQLGDLIINEYASDNDANGNDFFELLVLRNNVDLRGLRLTDNELAGSPTLNNGESVFVFGQDNFLSNLPAGTLIAVYTTSAGITSDTSVNPALNDWKLILAPGTGITTTTDGLGGGTNTGLSTSGEALYVYLPGPNADSSGTDNVYLDFVSYEADAADAPAGLADLNLPSVADNAYYTGSSAAGNDLAANWVLNGALGTETPGEPNPTQDLSALRSGLVLPGVALIDTNSSTIAIEGAAIGFDGYSINLRTTPTGPVTLTATADAQTEISIDAGLTFGSSRSFSLSSSAPQNILVRAIDDVLPEATPHFGAITHAITASSDTTNYPTSFPIGSLSVSITDNDTTSSLTPIPAIQGSSAASPFAGQVLTLQGVVTADFQGASGQNGFYLQDTSGDANSATSDGIFIYVPAANPLSSIDVQAGQLVRVTGRVVEFNTFTEIDNVTEVSVLGTASLPAPIDLALPVASVTELERYEGMSVRFTQPLTVTETFLLGRYGQLALAANGRLFQPTNLFAPGSPAALALSAENALRTIYLDDASGIQNPNPIPHIGADSTTRSGDSIVNLTGVLDYGPVGSDASVRYYRVQPTVAPAPIRTNPRTLAPAAVGGNVKVASFNVLNYFTTLDNGSNGARGADTPAEFTRQRAKIIAAITAIDADILGLVEMENNGPVAIGDLVAGLNVATAPGTYAVITDPTGDPEPSANRLGTDAIKVAFIYQPARVTPSGVALTSANTIFSRPPVAQTFTVNSNSAKFSVCVNHFKSKGGTGTGADADQGDGQGAFNATRIAQSQALLSFINTVQSAAADPDVLVIGDLNAYAEEDPIFTLTSAGLVNEASRWLGVSAYSYIFNGQTGYLDHALSTASLTSQVTGLTEWHINADEPIIIDYNTEFKTQDLYAPTPFRSSDHDPVIVGLQLLP